MTHFLFTIHISLKYVISSFISTPQLSKTELKTKSQKNPKNTQKKNSMDHALGHCPLIVGEHQTLESFEFDSK